MKISDVTVLVKFKGPSWSELQYDRVHQAAKRAAVEAARAEAATIEIEREAAEERADRDVHSPPEVEAAETESLAHRIERLERSVDKLHQQSPNPFETFDQWFDRRIVEALNPIEANIGALSEAGSMTHSMHEELQRRVDTIDKASEKLEQRVNNLSMGVTAGIMRNDEMCARIEKFQQRNGELMKAQYDGLSEQIRKNEVAVKHDVVALSTRIGHAPPWEKPVSLRHAVDDLSRRISHICETVTELHRRIDAIPVPIEAATTHGGVGG